MAHSSPPRAVAVVDIGSTNIKLSLFDARLNLLANESMPSRWVEWDYLSIDIEEALTFIDAVLPRFDQIAPVDAIVPVSHGSSLALMNDAGELVLPIMAYEATPPPKIRGAYEQVAPEFEEVFAPINPGALTLGLQLFWQETEFGEQFDKARTIVPLAQYVAYRLTSNAVSECSALGAQTQLWDPVKRQYSKLAIGKGWADRFAPIAPAWQILGTWRQKLQQGRGEVLTGAHDSNANYVRYMGLGDHCLISSGTWIIAFDGQVDLAGLDSDADQVTNTTIFGDPVACCRFMGGKEFELASDCARPECASIRTAGTLLRNRHFAIPSFTDSGGPLRGSGGRGGFDPGLPETEAGRASLASLYCAQMTAVALDRLGASTNMVVDGPFASNHLYLSTLARCREGTVAISATSDGTERGAALLACAPDIRRPAPPADLRAVDPAKLAGLGAYHKQWLRLIEEMYDSMGSSS